MTSARPWDGERWLRGALAEADLSALDALSGADGRPGARVSTLGQALAPVTAALSHLMRGARPVRCVAFAKDDGVNWELRWHQDRVISVADRHDAPGFANWTRKAGRWHCEPPIAVLERMLFVRVHLDACNAENGAMEIASGSHAEGRVSEADAEIVAGRYVGLTCVAGRGDIQVLPMLTLHRSGRSRSGKPRRALRIDYACDALPAPLRWADLQP